MKNEVLLFSGGMDSLIAWHLLGKPKTLYIDLKHKYSKQERDIVSELIPSTIIREFDLSPFEESDANIPLRNLYLAMLAVNLDFNYIWLIVQKDEMSIPDRSAYFLNTASYFLSYLSNKGVNINTPFSHMDKIRMVENYLRKGGDPELLKRTWACYHPVGYSHCGDCPACFRRFVAMKLNGIYESWHKKVQKSKVAEDYKEKALNSYYSEERNRNILKALGELNE